MNHAHPLAPPPVPDHELLRCVGRGSYGEVWLARNIMGTFRGVKIVRRSSFEQDRPFEREFAGIEKYEPVSRTHPGLVAILHVGRGEGCFYYVMEVADDQAAGPQIAADGYVPKTLDSELARRGRLPVSECVQLGLALTDALAHLHQHGLVHRDIKPSNIIFVNRAPKFADIGLVTGLGEQATFVGTAGYLAPEGPGAAPADLFGLGKVLYEISMGKDRESFPELPSQLRELPDAPALVQLNAVILKACEHDPRARFSSAAEMHAALAALAKKLAPEKILGAPSDTNPTVAVVARRMALWLSPAGDVQVEELVRRLAERFRTEGVEAIIDDPGQPSLRWARELERLVERTGLVIALLSPVSVGSELVAYGLELAGQAARRKGGGPRLAAVRVGFDGALPKLFDLALADAPVLSWNTPADDERVASTVLNWIKDWNDKSVAPETKIVDRSPVRPANQ